MEDKDFYWLIGLLEGEGTFLRTAPSEHNRPKIALHMTDLDVVQRVADLFGVSTYFVKSKNPKHKDSYVTKIGGMKAYELMKKLHPHMSKRRQAQIARAMATFDPSTYNAKGGILTKEQIEWCRKELPNSSLRKLAKQLGVNHETIRDNLKRTHLS